MPRELCRLALWRVNLTENVEIRYAPGSGPSAHCRHEALPEFRIDMLGGVDAEAVNVVLFDPVAEYLDETAHHARILGHHIVEAEEITHRGTLATERRIAAVVIVDRVVQPFGNLGVLLPRWHERRIGIVGARQFREVLVGLIRRCIAEESAIDLLAREAAAPRVGIV